MTERRLLTPALAAGTTFGSSLAEAATPSLTGSMRDGRGQIVATGAGRGNRRHGVGNGSAKFGAQAGVAGAVPFKATTTGYDNRTPAGGGRVALVGGSLSRTFPTDGSDPPEGSVVNISRYKFTFTPQPSLPLGSPPMLLTLGALVLLSAGFAVSRRGLS